MTAAQLASIPKTRAYLNCRRACYRIGTAKDKPRAVHTWAKWMKLVIAENS